VAESVGVVAYLSIGYPKGSVSPQDLLAVRITVLEILDSLGPGEVSYQKDSAVLRNEEYSGAVDREETCILKLSQLSLAQSGGCSHR
jgi:hypothetical protein